jgi:uncharacterized protein YchJ
MEDFLINLEQAKRRCLHERRDHDFTLVFAHSNYGLTVSVSLGKTVGSVKKTSDYCKLKMYQLKLSKWIFLEVGIKDTAETYDFRVFQKEWSHNQEMEEKLKEYRRQKVTQFLASNNKPGRNDPCPCNSGKKWKKCCANESWTSM